MSYHLCEKIKFKKKKVSDYDYEANFSLLKKHWKDRLYDTFTDEEKYMDFVEDYYYDMIENIYLSNDGSYGRDPNGNGLSIFYKLFIRNLDHHQRKELDCKLKKERRKN